MRLLAYFPVNYAVIIFTFNKFLIFLTYNLDRVVITHFLVCTSYFEHSPFLLRDDPSMLTQRNEETTPVTTRQSIDHEKFSKSLDKIRDAQQKVKQESENKEISKSTAEFIERLEKAFQVKHSSQSPATSEIKKYSSIVGTLQKKKSKILPSEPLMESKELFPSGTIQKISKKISLSKLGLTPEKFEDLETLTKLKTDLNEFDIPLNLKGSFNLEAVAYNIRGEKCFTAGDIDAVSDLSNHSEDDLEDSLENEPGQLKLLKLVMLKHGFKELPSSSETCLNFISDNGRIEISAPLPGYKKNPNPFPLTDLTVENFSIKDGTIELTLDDKSVKTSNHWVGRGLFPVNPPKAHDTDVKQFYYRLLNYTQSSKNKLSAYYNFSKSEDSNNQSWHKHLEVYFKELVEDKNLHQHLNHHYHSMTKMIKDRLFFLPDAWDILFHFCKAKINATTIVPRPTPALVDTVAENITNFLQEFFKKHPGQANKFSVILADLLKQPLNQLADESFYAIMETLLIPQSFRPTPIMAMHSIIKNGIFSEESSKKNILNFCHEHLRKSNQDDTLLDKASENMTTVLQSCFKEGLLNEHNFLKIVKNLSGYPISELSDSTNVPALISSIADKMFASPVMITIPASPSSTQSSSSPIETPSPLTRTPSPPSRTPSPYSPTLKLSPQQPSRELLRQDSPPVSSTNGVTYGK